MLAGVLEREREKTPPKPVAVVAESEAEEAESAEPTPQRGRGGSSSRPRAAAAAGVKKTKARTIHLPDDLFERILVQSHRRDKTISEYVAMLLDRHVPDHRVVRPAGAADDEAA